MRDCPGTAAPRELAFFWQQKKARKENCRCFDAADPRLGGCTPPRPPKRKSEGAGAKRKQYYFSFLTPPPLPPLLSRGLRGCERGATVERSETGERAMFAPAGQTTARACLRSKLAALVVRRQAPPNPRCRKQQSVGAGHARPAALPLPPPTPFAANFPSPPVNGKGGGLPPSLAPLVRHPSTPPRRGRACPARSLASAPGLVLHPLYLLHRREGLRGCEQGPRLSGAKPGCEQCLPLRGKQPHERVCEANWRRSLCAAKR